LAATKRGWHHLLAIDGRFSTCGNSVDEIPSGDLKFKNWNNKNNKKLYVGGHNGQTTPET
jgi:hypothetical protein